MADNSGILDRLRPAVEFAYEVSVDIDMPEQEFRRLVAEGVEHIVDDVIKEYWTTIGVVSSEE